VRDARQARGVSVKFRYLDHKDAWVSLAPPPAEGRDLSAAQLVRIAVSEATARGIRCMGTTLELASPMTHVVLGALQRHLGTDLTSVALRRAGSSVMVTALLLDSRLVHPVTGEVVTARGPSGPSSRPAVVLAR
jgi:hypothetical protein